MTVEQLEELLGIIGCTDDHLHFGAVEELRNLAPSLARRVIAAEKLVEALALMRDTTNRAGMYDLADEAITAYREACK